MRIKRENLNLIFGRIPPEKLAKNIANDNNSGISYKEIPEDIFINLSFSNNGYSKDERREQYNILNNDMCYNGYNYTAKKSVFNLLFDFSNTVLTTKHYVPICKYSELLKWNDTSHDLSQDLFTTSFLAFKDVKTAAETNYFAWNPIIDTTNDRLYKMLNQGIAENHYHLYGSSQSFQLNWIAIMNNPRILNKHIHKLYCKLTPRVSYSADYNITPWLCKLMWAATIRAYLFKKLNNIPSYKEKKLNLKEILNINAPNLMVKYVENLNYDLNSLKFILGLRLSENDFCLDYAINKNMHADNFNYNRILVGERKFLYDCFKAHLKDKLTDYECNLFYLYILIKTELRNEFIQTNKEYGFKNFSDFQNRKFLFIGDDPSYKNEAIKLALNLPLSTQPIKMLEARIMPSYSEDKLKKHIEIIDQTYDSVEKNRTFFQYKKNKSNFKMDKNRKYFFVIHYPKSRFILEKSKYRPLCRNSRQRKKNRKITEKLVNALSMDAYVRDRIKGLDACSNEIGCRPEVFATDFRYLREVIPVNKKSIYGKQEKPAQLRLTYHVGEDFLNITNGLRAIDEAMLFLNMQRCDRLGHALALGIDVNQYYKVKDYRIIIPKQDALDDDVWLLYKANELNINVEKALEQRLVYRIQDRIRYIYGDSLKKFNIQVDSFVYYNSWKLRGDNPELYKEYKFDDSKIESYGYESFMVNKMLPINNLRSDVDTAALYAIYHYDDNAKAKGLETENIKITPDYIKLVKEIQKRMQFVIAEKGIMIECNPTSNYLIGTFRRYDAHPITKFNNTFLDYGKDNISNCAQICVSINTDDQGVFDTSLINEYALMALALEKKKDENGNRVYSASSVYQYLDYVRQMGFEQSFND